jgi:hypothetical protein
MKTIKIMITCLLSLSLLSSCYSVPSKYLIDISLAKNDAQREFVVRFNAITEHAYKIRQMQKWGLPTNEERKNLPENQAWSAGPPACCFLPLNPEIFTYHTTACRYPQAMGE